MSNSHPNTFDTVEVIHMNTSVPLATYIDTPSKLALYVSDSGALVTLVHDLY